ncbi:hypothetical protein [Photobacterium atrarenae]|uniref:Uncharacterized protein n=1 Tax=Photobacterium atrarenae TaxID=865757 RepID=A0ABY5GI80_9GAMM|nr:hypothetical protein [Photobacterium atrarenae]UTV28987.1 hypothetical protein NNL38_07090 [Photobacterium atrarenae]
MGATALKLLVLMLELFAQVKRRDAYEERQERLSQAKADPAGYLRQFGRVRGNSDNPSAPVRGDPAGTEPDDT